MIFNSNTTSLSTVAMAEGYDCSTGIALALIESAQSDREMFKAMLDIDARELSMNESANITALNEAAISGIFKKIAELFKKLAEKIKAIAHSFATRLNSLFMNDKDFVKKYKNEVLRKSNIDNLEVNLVVDTDGDPLLIPDTFDANNDVDDVTQHLSGYDPSSEKRLDYWASNLANFDSYEELCDMKVEKDEFKVSDVGGMRVIISSLEKAISNFSKFNSNINKLSNKLEQNSKKFDRLANQATSKSQDELDEANQAYEMAVSYQTVMLKVFELAKSYYTEVYKSLKAAFVKAATVSAKKLEESMIYANAIAEEAEQEVEDVIAGAIETDCPGCGVQSVSVATTDVKDADVKDDAELNTYDKVQSYSDDTATEDEIDGTVDINIDSKEESAFFGTMFY